jgi:hypothetical protein
VIKVGFTFGFHKLVIEHKHVKVGQLVILGQKVKVGEKIKFTFLNFKAFSNAKFF